MVLFTSGKPDSFVLSDTSESTIRRDLDELAADGKLKRVHGGAESIHSLKGRNCQ